MRIRTYNQENGMISEKEVKCRIPRYVQEFDDSHPLVHISNREYKLLNSKSESIEKLLLIERYRQILQFDYSLFLDSWKGHKILSSLSNEHIVLEPFPDLGIDNICNDRNWLFSVVDYILAENEDRHLDPVKIKIWLDYIKSESEDSWTSFFNKRKQENSFKDIDVECWETIMLSPSWDYACLYYILLDTLRNKVYPQLKRKSIQSRRLKSILRLIPTHYSCQLDPYSFDNDKFVIKICNSLYEINSKRRSDVYGIVLTYNILSHAIVDSNYAFLNVSSEEYRLSINNKGERQIDVVMSSEENAQLRTSNRPNKLVAFTKDALSEIYGEFCSKCANEIEKDIRGDFITYLDGITIDEAKAKHWRELYVKLRKDICLKKDLMGRDQPMPFFYALLLRHDNKYNNVIESDDFIKDLLLINDRFHSVILTDVLGYIFQFNYIKSKAYPVKSNPSEKALVSTDDPFVWESNYFKKYTLEESVERALSFIAPILNSKYIVKSKDTGDLVISPEKFRTDFRSLFMKDDMPETVHRTLLCITKEYTDKDDRYPYQGFNYKLLFNIIGMLKSYYDKDAQKDVLRIFIKVSKHLVDELMKDRTVIERKEGWSAFRKYLAYYKSYVEKDGTESFSIADEDTIKYVQKHFNVAEDIFIKVKKKKFI